MSGKFEIMNMDMKLGTTLKIKGKIADDANGFVINLGQGTDTLDLHFNPRFGESTIVCNSWDGNNWGQEQREDHMCFSPGSEVKAGPQPPELPECAGRVQPLLLQAWLSRQHLAD
ncbi:galectin-2 isoform X3 [Desmodus rotundus]|uniref:galectin-2 isoform X3 n=1 Tax=Desmodus rotundus TaxID=9430 RepID=UPI001E1C079C|nr:galectin-2 isoform X3 [Desmodus rotundus]